MPSHILLIRHGEKPDSGPELSPQGWERAKALPAMFDRQPYKDFGVPAALFGMGAKEKSALEGGNENSDDTTSVRAIQTLKYVGERFGLPVIDKYRKGDEQELADYLRNDKSLDGKFVVICWEHKALSDLANDFGVSPVPKYPGDHFDRAWLLTMDGEKVQSFQNLPEKVLPGDDQN